MDKKVEFDLEEYLAGGVKQIIKDLAKSVYKNAKISKFMIDFAISSNDATKKRHEYEQKGEHIPAFLIASITNSCNLHCEGCYAIANKHCADNQLVGRSLMKADEWGKLFSEAEDLGISFIILAGGEPMLRMDVLTEAAKHRKVLFPIFTNGTLIEKKQFDLFMENQNLIPIISIEGEKDTTDNRRGDGVYEKIAASMDKLNRLGIAFGASITVTKYNMQEVLSKEFVSQLYSKGCKVIIYVEYVPMNEFSKLLAVDDGDREIMKNQLDVLRNENNRMLLLVFPGDEISTGGCLAAGRGFFHINAFGFAEPCPFSAYSDTNVKELGIRNALKSPLFQALNEEGIMNSGHIGGCVLFNKKTLVEKLCEKTEKCQLRKE